MSNQASLGDIGGSDKSPREENSDKEFKETSLGKIPADWKVKNLGEDFEINYGDGKKEDEFVEDGDYPVYGANGIIGRSDDYIYQYPVVTVTCRGATCGNVNLTKPKSWVTNNSLVLENGNENNPIFLAEALRQHSVDRAITGSAQPQITSTLLSKMDYLKVPLPEQRRIASVFYNVDQAISKTEEIIEQTQRVKKGLMQDLFTEGYYSHEGFEEVRVGPMKYRIPERWSKKSIDKLTDKVTSSKRVHKADYVEDGVPFYRSKEIIEKSKGLDVSDPHHISEEKFKELDEKYGSPEEGDLLITAVGTLGVPYLVEDETFYFKDGNLQWLKNPQIAYEKFLRYFMSTEIFQNQIIQQTSGSSQKALTIGNLKKMEIFVPEEDEQNKICRTIDSLDGRLANNRKQKEQLQRLKKGLMQDLLTGSVRTGEDVRVLDEVVEVEG